MEASLQSDFQVLEGFLKKVQEMMEALQHDAVKQLAGELLRLYHEDESLSIRVVPAQYAEEIKAVLLQKHIPMMFTPDSAGNILFLLPSEKNTKRYQKAEEAINQVFMHHPEYYRQLEAGTWCSLAKNDRVSGVIALTFANQTEADIFRNKAFADAQGIVTTDLTNADGSVTIYCRENDLINETKYRDVVDAIVDTEVSLQEQAYARQYAVWHDRKQTDFCMEMFEKGENFVIHSGVDKRSDYLEFQDGIFQYHTYDKTSNSYAVREIPYNPEDLDSIRKCLEHHMSFIHNSYVSTEDEYRVFQGRSESYIREEYVAKQKQLYTKVLLSMNRDGGIFRGASFEEQFASKAVQAEIRKLGLEDVRPDFSIDFLQSLLREEEQKAEELSREAQTIKQERQTYWADQRQDLLARSYAFVDGMEASGLMELDGVPVMDMKTGRVDSTLDNISLYLGRETEKARQAMNDICWKMWGNLPDSDPKLMIRAAQKQGLTFPSGRQAEVNRLLHKSNLTEEDQKRLQQLGLESMYYCAGKRTLEAETRLTKLQLLVGKSQELLDISNHLKKKLAEGEKDTAAFTRAEQAAALKKELPEEDLSDEKVRRYYNCLLNARTSVSTAEELKQIIGQETVHKEKIASLQKACHEQIREQRRHRWNTPVKDVLEQVKEKLAENNLKIKHMKIESVPLKQLEHQIEERRKQLERQRERETEQEKETPDLEEEEGERTR